MTLREHVPLAPYTTLGVGGAARFFIEADTDDTVREAIAFSRKEHLPLFALGNGSNLLVPDEGVNGCIVRTAMSGMRVEDAGDAFTISADAGALWDDVVDAIAAQGVFGIENLAGIPGTVAGAAVQNIGAYGAELRPVFSAAECISLDSGESLRVNAEDARFAYRTSIFKEEPTRIILRVLLRLPKNARPNLSYADLARAKESGVPLETPPEIAAAVRGIRAKKFPAKGQGTAGSFFKNPVIPKEKADPLAAKYPGLPLFPQETGVKVPLAWLLDHALGLKGYARGFVRLFEKQPLVIVAETGASASDVDAFAREIETRVFDATDIVIEREVETFGVR